MMKSISPVACSDRSFIFPLQIVDLTLPSNIDGWQVAHVYYSNMAADGNMHYIVRALCGEPLHPYYRALHYISQIPNFLRSIIRLAFILLTQFPPRFLQLH